MSDLDFYFDPVCPWAWITSRWVSEVQSLRSYDVRWKFISLKILNKDNSADWYTDQYKRWHQMGHEALRVAAHLDTSIGNDAVARFYTVLGTEGHNKDRREDFSASTEAFVGECLAIAGFDSSLVSYAFDDSLDGRIQSDTDEALKRTGPDVGTPILTFAPGTDREGSFFGPVIARIPRGEEALRLWDAVEIVATTPGVAELKRSLRAAPVFD